MPRPYIRRSLSWCQEMALARGGVCLSTEYKNPHTPMQWRCANGHEWAAKANTISNGNWCGACSQVAKKSVSWLVELATKRNGKCLSTEYKNNKTKYSWECNEGHQWEATANDIAMGKWCPTCSGNQPHTLDWLDSLALRRDGRCLAAGYSRIGAKYCWQCSKGHRWEATANDISQGSWCPKCFAARSAQETEVLDFVSALVPGEEVLSRDRKALDGLELDIYIPGRKLAIEYCGLHWHGELQSGMGSHMRHLQKLRRCEEKGIRLLTVFADEWLRSRQAAEGYLKAVLSCGLACVGARKTQVRSVSVGDVAEFVDQHHIQGVGNGGDKAYALFHGDEVVAAAIFRRASEKGRGAPEDGVWELSRYCVKSGVRVQGGLGKILSAFGKDESPSVIITFADRRWSAGNVYRATGFALEATLPPSYWYFEQGTPGPRFHKSGFRKSVLLRRYGGDPRASEWTLAQAAGFDRVWDCGLERWVWRREQS